MSTERLTQEPKVRMSWVDQAKGIGIFLVVLGHAIRGLVSAELLERTPVVAWIDDFIYSFHMPLFFFLAGLFLPRQTKTPFSLITYVLDKFRTLVWAYLVWSILQTLVQYSIGQLVKKPVDLSDAWRMMYRPVMQFWFLYALLIIVLLYGVLRKIRIPSWGILLLFLVWKITGPWVPMGDWGIPYMARNFAVHVALGAVVGTVPSWIAFPSKWSFVQATFYTLAGFGLLVLWNEREPLHDSPEFMLRALTGIVGTLGLASLFTRIRWSAFVEEWGRYSLQIYVIHTIASAGFRIGMQKFLKVTDPTIHLIGGTLFGIYLPLVIARLADRLGWQILFQWKRHRVKPVASIEQECK